MEISQYHMLRIWKTTYRLLRQLAANTDESLIELIDRLAREELQRQQKTKQQQDTRD